MGQVTESWKESAREKLGGRFEELKIQEEELKALEGELEEEDNVRGLVKWGEMGGGRGLEERVQVLDAVLSGVWAMGEPGGRFTKVVRRWERWVGGVEAVVAKRKEGGRGGLKGLLGGGEVWVGEMDGQWREDCKALERRLDEMRKGLRGVTVEEGEIEGCVLGRVLKACEALVDGMLEELEVMGRIEREVKSEEMRWVREVNRAVGEDVPRAGAIWRAV